MLKKIGLPAIALLGSRSGRRGPPLGAAGPPVGSTPRFPLPPVTGGSDMLDRRRDGRLRTAVFSWARGKYTGWSVGERLAAPVSHAAWPRADRGAAAAHG